MTDPKQPFKVKAYKYKGKSSSPMEFKFLSGGVPFFGLVNPNSLNKVRFDAVQGIYAELERGVDEEKLNGFLAVVKEALWSRDEAKQKEALWLTDTLEKRGVVANYAHLAFKMASIYFVGQDEDYDIWDREVAAKKATFWKTHEQDLNAFFLKTYLTSTIHAN